MLDSSKWNDERQDKAYFGWLTDFPENCSQKQQNRRVSTSLLEYNERRFKCGGRGVV